MPQQLDEVEHAEAQASSPRLDQRARARHVSGRAAHGPAVAQRTHGLDHHVDPMHLARQRVAREHALSMTAVATARETHLDPAVDRPRAQSALHAARRELERPPATLGAEAPSEYVDPGGDERPVVDRLHPEYVDHVRLGRLRAAG